MSTDSSNRKPSAPSSSAPASAAVEPGAAAPATAAPSAKHPDVQTTLGAVKHDATTASTSGDYVRTLLARAATPEPAAVDPLIAVPSLPKGGGALRGMADEHSVTLLTGTYSTSVPVPLSPGRHGHTPSPAVSYQSSTGNGPFGMGWQLGVPSFQRRTDRGVPRYINEGPTADVFVSPAGELLPRRVRPNGDISPAGTASSDAWTLDERTVPCLGDGGGQWRVVAYVPRTESDFTRIERWQAPNGDTHWQTVTGANVRSFYGLTAASRVVDPAQPKHVFAWHLCWVIDARGLATEYVYKGEDGASVPAGRSAFEGTRGNGAHRYLKAVRYGFSTAVTHDGSVDPLSQTFPDDPAFELLVDYGEHDIAPGSAYAETSTWPMRSDSFSSFRSGFEIRQRRRAQRLLMFHRIGSLSSTPVLVRSLNVTYDDDPVGAKLVSIASKSYAFDSATSTWDIDTPPALSYQYRPFEPQHQVQTLRMNGGNIAVDGRQRRWVDLHGEGVAGALEESGGAMRFRRNEGDGTLGQAVVVPTVPTGTGGASSGTSFTDLFGDGSLSVVAWSGPQQGYFQHDRLKPDWQPLRRFRALPNLAWQRSNVRFLDVDGDGRSDVLVDHGDRFAWYRFGRDGGFEGPFATFKPSDEAVGPAVLFQEAKQTVFLADMTGDGLTDIVRIRPHAVSYWPSLGRARWGARVDLDLPLPLGSVHTYDPARVRLADIDGTGAADLLYFGSDGATLYRNESGNRFAAPLRLHSVPPLVTGRSVDVADVLGQGTSCIVWADSDHRGGGVGTRYVDLCAGQKPHLMMSSSNGMGTRRVLHFRSSVHFDHEDRRKGTSWVTRLPFPVHVLSRQEIFDEVNGGKLCSSYKYHDGYYDAADRAFRGFGMVEQCDTEAFDLPQSSGTPTRVAPKIRVRTWHELGAVHARPLLEAKRLQQQWNGDAEAIPLPGVVFESPVSNRLVGDAYRALQGRVIRMETHAIDGSDVEAIPLMVADTSYTIRTLQPDQAMGPDREWQASFFVWTSQTRQSLYDRVADDPRVSLSAVLDCDPFGVPLRQLTVALGRRVPSSGPAPSAFQTHSWATLSESVVAHHPSGTGDHDFRRLAVPLETKAFELLHLDWQDLYGGTAWPSVETLATAVDDAVELAPGAPATSSTTVYQRLLQRSIQTWRPDAVYDGGGAELQPVTDTVNARLLLPYETYLLAISATQLETAFAADGSGQGAWVENQIPAITDTVWASQGYVRLASGTVADGLYARSGRVLPSLAATFYRPDASLDVYGGRADVTWDAEGLFPASMQIPEVPGATGPVRLTQSFEHDYRVLAPWRVTDPNGNRSAVRFDAAGRPLAMALLGKTTDTGTDLLDQPTARYTYVLNSWDVSVPEDRVPPHVIAQQKEQFGEAWDLEDPHFRYQESIAYSDGFGRDAGSRQRVESGPLTPGGDTITDRWVMAGRVIYDAKGRPVQQFEPCFVEGAAWHPEDLVEHGVASTLHYDAAGRVHRVHMPDGTHARTVFSPWRIEQWDTNDTVLGSDWLNRTDVDPAAKDASQRVARTPLVLDMDALGRARRLERVRRDHKWNPGSGHTQFDRPLLTDVSHVETVTLDIEGRALACTDARGNTVYSATYSVSALPLAVASKDTGRSWALFRADGRPWLSWTGVETAAASESAAPRYRTRMTYDALHRPIARFLQTNDARDGGDAIIETVREWTLYGERSTDAAHDNRLGTAWRAFDAAGMVESTGFTFAGQPFGSVRRLTSGWVGQPDWTATLQALSTSVGAAQTAADSLLETTAYATAMTWDALGRPVTTTSPAESGRPASTTTFGYDRGGRWKSTALTLRGASTSTTVVDDVQYNARGQRTRIVHGSGVTTTSTYDPFTFWLTRQHAVRDPSGTPVSLQDLLYTYDAAGTVVRLEDDAQQSVWFDNAVVDAVWTYGHDDLGRLVWATGREHAQAAGPAPWGEPHARQALPNPGPNAMHAYSETYTYDAAGNLLEHEHTVPLNSAANRTRTYTYEIDDHRMATAKFEGELTPRSVSHDSLGRMTALPGVDFAEWDDANNLVFTKTSSGANLRAYYVYDAGGQRVRKVVEEYLAGSWSRTKETRYLGGFELQRQFVGGALDHERETLHVMDDTRRVALIETDTVDDGDPVTTPSPLLRYQFDNHLRSACVETNASGEVISYEEFHPYGTTAYHAGLDVLDANPKRYRYSGKERDAESGLYYYGARYLAPWLGRWVSPDPAGFVDGVNVYQMCSGNPASKFDPDGRNPWTAWLDMSQQQADTLNNYDVEYTFEPELIEGDPGIVPQGLQDIGAMNAAANDWLDRNIYSWVLPAAIRADETIAANANRIAGAGKVLGAVGEGMAAAGLALAPEPTGVTKAAALALAFRAGNGLGTGLLQMWDNQPHQTLLSMGVTEVADDYVSQETAVAIGEGTDALVGFGATFGVSRFLSSRLSTISTGRGASSLGDEAASSGVPGTVDEIVPSSSASASGTAHTASVAPLPDLGRKLDYFFGQATGSAHNIERSQDMLRQLTQIGYPDNAASREFLTNHLVDVFRGPVSAVQANGRTVRHSVILGPYGFRGFETIWEGDRLITGMIFGGRYL